MKSFYVYLPSNVNDLTERNIIGNYTTHLPQSIHLDGEWEVGLSEIIYTKNWFNLLDQTIYIYSKGFRLASSSIILPGDLYLDTKTIAKEINKQVETALKSYYSQEDIQKFPRLDVGEKRNYLLPGIFKNKMVKLFLTPELRKVFGFKDDINYTNVSFYDKEETIDGKSIEGGEKSVYNTNINNNIYALFVYTDIIKASVTGNTYSKLLRIVKAANTAIGQVSQFTFGQPQYHPVEKREIHSIEIDIKDDTGETLRFKGGRVYVVLHFRRIDNE